MTPALFWRPLAALPLLVLLASAGCAPTSSPACTPACAPEAACVDGRCVGPSCTDRVQNGAESDVDCGGTACRACLDGKVCGADTDCQSGRCSGGLCAGAGCGDRVKNGDETDVDCGGGCDGCATGQSCRDGEDCASGRCSGNVCVLPTCGDGQRNGEESDVDCGGPLCPACGGDRACGEGADCQSGVCELSQCAAPACTDGVKNGLESDVDCGGAACPSCGVSRGCVAPADCVSGVCSQGQCAPPGCGDGQKNGQETDVDCGGQDCGKCGTGRKCSGAQDCQGGICSGEVCAAPTCMDGVKNGSESDADCGGMACERCVAGRSCGAAADCASGVCASDTCSAPTCADQVKNGDELGVDCGGSACTPCPTVLILGTSGAGTFAAHRVAQGAWVTRTLAVSSDAAPAVTLTSSLLGVGLVKRTDLSLQSTTWSSGTWAAPSEVGMSITTRAAPVLAADGATAQAVFHGENYKHYYTSFGTGGMWTTPSAMGSTMATESYGPQPAGLAARGGEATVLFANGAAGNDVYGRDRTAGGFSGASVVVSGVDYDVPPAVVALASSSTLLAVTVQASTQKLRWQKRAAGTWSAPAELPLALTTQPISLTALADGGALLSFRGRTNSVVYVTRFSAGTWSAPASIATPQVTTTAPPVVARGAGARVAVLAYVGADGKAYFSELSGAEWTAPVAVGGANLVGVAIAAGP